MDNLNKLKQGAGGEIQLTDSMIALSRLEAFHAVRFDGDELRRQSADLSKRMLAAQQKATELAGRTFNLDSPKQLGTILFEKMQLPVLRKTAGGAPSTDEEVLTRLAADYPAVGKAQRQQFRVVLLDEYQDTGHAQRMLLASLFGGGVQSSLSGSSVVERNLDRLTIFVGLVWFILIIGVELDIKFS